MVLCWVDINLWPGQVPDFLALGKCSRQWAYINLTSRPKWCRRSLYQRSRTLSQGRKILNETGSDVSVDPKVNFSGFPWHNIWYKSGSVSASYPVCHGKKYLVRKSRQTGAEMSWLARKNQIILYNTKKYVPILHGVLWYVWLFASCIALEIWFGDLSTWFSYKRRNIFRHLKITGFNQK